MLQPITPVIIKVVPPATPEMSVADLIVDALGLTGVITIAAIIVGLFLGVALIVFKRWRDRDRPAGQPPGTQLGLSSR